MPRRKKYPKLPNGYGSIKYLGAKRRNPYAVHPPVTEFAPNGSPITPKALEYVDDWYYGFAILTAYKAGTYVKGEYPQKPKITSGDIDLEELARSILADYNRISDTPEVKKLTFAEVYDGFFEYKFRENQKKIPSKQTKNSTRAAFKNCATIHDKIFEELTHKDLQKVVDDCPLKHSSLELIVTLFHQMYAYADMERICTIDASKHVRINIKDDDEKGVPFSDKEMATLWKHKDDEIIEMVLIMCYSGFRITAYLTLDINLEENYFQGGIKTDNGKNRIVPIHSGILPLVQKRLLRYDGKLLPEGTEEFRQGMYAKLSEFGIDRHTPHDCRHTFSRLAEKYQVNENDRKRMLGHSFSGDITNSVYGHRAVEDLRTEIEKIKICY